MEGLQLWPEACGNGSLSNVGEERRRIDERRFNRRGKLNLQAGTR